MRFVSTAAVVDKLELARNVPSERPDGAPLLRAGTVVSPELAARAAASGICGIWVGTSSVARSRRRLSFPQT